MTGIEMIANERRRQLEVKGYGPEHDDLHVDGELAVAAACYAMAGDEAAISRAAVMDVETLEDAFPWGADCDNRGEKGRIRELVIAGALIAAEIDRLLRLEAKE
jgi:hypothetical protein